MSDGVIVIGWRKLQFDKHVNQAEPGQEHDGYLNTEQVKRDG